MRTRTVFVLISLIIGLNNFCISGTSTRSKPLICSNGYILQNSSDSVTLKHYQLKFVNIDLHEDADTLANLGNSIFIVHDKQISPEADVFILFEKADSIFMFELDNSLSSFKISEFESTDIDENGEAEIVLRYSNWDGSGMGFSFGSDHFLIYNFEKKLCLLDLTLGSYDIDTKNYEQSRVCEYEAELSKNKITILLKEKQGNQTGVGLYYTEGEYLFNNDRFILLNNDFKNKN